MSSITELYEIHQKKYKDKSSMTHTTFRTALNRLSKIYPELKEGNIQFLNDIDEIKKTLLNKYSFNTLVSTISNIIKLIRLKKGSNDLESKYQLLLTDLTDEKNKQLGKQELSDKRKEQYVPFNDIQAKLNETYEDYLNNKKSFSEYRRYLLLNLFTRNVPVRLGNYLNMKIVRKPTKDTSKYNNKDTNYLLVYPNKYVFVFNKYKTSKTYNQKIAEVKNGKMKTLISRWLKDYNKENIFMVNSDRSPSNQKGLTADLKAITKKLFDKSFSVDMLRSSYITHLYDTDPNLETKEKIARAMGHSVTTSEKHYNKDLKPDKERDELGLPIDE